MFNTFVVTSVLNLDWDTEVVGLELNETTFALLLLLLLLLSSLKLLLSLLSLLFELVVFELVVFELLLDRRERNGEPWGESKELKPVGEEESKGSTLLTMTFPSIVKV